MSRPVGLLLIEDDIDDREIFGFALEKLTVPVNCIIAEDGEDALLLLEKPEQPKIDVVFLDLNVPGDVFPGRGG